MNADESFHSLIISLKEKLPCYSNFTNFHELYRDYGFIDTLIQVVNTGGDRLEDILIHLSDLLVGMNVC
jgi:hypothetical protein